MSDTMGAWSLAIAVASVIVAVVGIVRGFRTDRTAREAHEWAKIDRDRTKVQWKAQADWHGAGVARVSFTNIGWGDAVDVRINRHDLIELPLFDEPPAMPMCHAGESINILVESHLEEQVPQTVRVHWGLDQVQYVVTDEWRAYIRDNWELFLPAEPPDESEPTT